MQSYMERIREAGKVVINAERQWSQEQEKAQSSESAAQIDLDQFDMELQKRVVDG